MWENNVPTASPPEYNLRSITDLSPKTTMGRLWYEECRHKRMAENRKRMEALNLPQPSQVLRTASFKTFPSPVSKEASKASHSRESSCHGQEVGSGGVANKPAPRLQSRPRCPFCKMNLPKHDDVITLIDEEGDEYPTIHSARKTGLSGGWKGFALLMSRQMGRDALSFSVNPTHII